MEVIERPWGKMWLLVSLPTFWIKIILVRGRTSLQAHEHRTEYHISLHGIKKVVPLQVHRLGVGTYLELAFGAPREEDIIRYEDDYGRV